MCKRPIRFRYLIRASVGAVLVAAGPAAWSKPGFVPYVTVGVQNDSNVFMRPSGESPFAAEGITGLGDTIEEYTAGFDEQIGQAEVGDALRLSAQGSRDNYDRFSLLNHTEYHFGGELDWLLGPVLDGNVTYEQTHYMAPFTDTLALQLLLNTDRTLGVTARVHISPRWRLDVAPEIHQLDSPLPGFPDFRLHETLATGTLNYLGFGRLVSGLQFQYIQGRYDGIVGATRYDQRGAAVTATYKVTGLSSFGANVGYSERNSEANPVGVTQGPANGDYAGYAGTVGSASGLTGTLSYRRQFTGKTSASLSVFRRLDSYAAGANPEVGTGGELAVTWKPDAKVGVTLSYGITHDTIEGGLVIADVTNRSDRSQSAKAEIDYAAVSWLAIKPYVLWNQATSSFYLGNYSATTVGIDFTARFE